MSFKVDENNCANAGLKAYDGEERRSWQREADMLRSRLETIEGIAMDTKDLARATHDTVVAHVAEERETKAAIDELILLWRGSKLVVSGFKILIPIVAALLGAAIWFKDHFKW